jgi:phage gp37-like protein
MDKFREAIRAMVKEEMTNMLPTVKHDHEAKMAKSELRAMLTNGAALYKMIQEGQELSGWVSAYITLSADYINSVHEYMVEDQNK